MIAQQFNAEVLHYSTLCKLEKNKLIRIDSVTIRINNRAGDEYANVWIPYSKSENLSDISAWIEDRNGARKQVLLKKDMTDKSAVSAISLYEDNFLRCFILKYNQYPYTIKYTYKKTFEEFLEIARWAPVIYDQIPARESSLNIILPRSYQFRIFQHDIKSFSIDSTGENILIHFQSDFNEPLREECFPEIKNNIPYALVVPEYFHYGVAGCHRDWIAYGNWQHTLMQDLEELPEDEKRKVNNLIKGVTDRKEIIRILYHYLQDNTRYINVSIGIGGFRAYPASYVAKNKYGDCKALSNYMKALLSYAGIPSYFVYVNASSQPEDLIREYAGPQFNHVILAVPLETDTIWLENTSNTGPFGYVGTFVQNREGLIVSKDQSRLIHIPALKPKDNLVTRKFEFEPELTGISKLSMTEDCRGQRFEVFNELNSEYDDYEKDKIIREFMPFVNYEVEDWSLTRIHRDTPEIIFHATLKLSQFVKSLGDDYYMDASSIDLPAFLRPDERISPVDLPYPVYNLDTLIYHLPDGYEIKNKPDDGNIQTSFGSYDVFSLIKDRSLYVIKRFKLNSGSYTLARYPELYQFIQAVKEKDKLKLIIQPHN
jgi:hypothetical protein